MQDNQTQNPLLLFGKPQEVYVNGKKAPQHKIDVAVRIAEIYPLAVKSFVITRINGNVNKVKIQTYTSAENAKRFANNYGIDVDKYCTRHACMDCEYFDHVHMAEINRNCPLLHAKDAAIQCGYADLFIESIMSESFDGRQLDDRGRAILTLYSGSTPAPTDLGAIALRIKRTSIEETTAALNEYARKGEFVEKYLSPMLAAADMRIKQAVYRCNIATGAEYVDISYIGGYKRSVCVTADSLQALILDVMR